MTGRRTVVVGPGLWLVDKPVGVTSAFVVSVVKRAAGGLRTGHGGTLDPFASGLLPVLVGREYTRRASELLDGDKQYVAVIRLGSETDTCDLTGEVVARGGPLPATRREIEAVLPGFQGTVEQVPPGYCALKLDGKPLYWYARRGLEVSKPPRLVHIDELALVEYLPPDATLFVRCGKGVYVRSLARDIGRTLGCMAHVVGLRRVAVGSHRIEDARPLWEVAAAAGIDWYASARRWNRASRRRKGS